MKVKSLIPHPQEPMGMWEVGAVVEFGRLPTSNRPLKWLVIDKKLSDASKKFLIVSKRPIGKLPYDKDYDHMDWEKYAKGLFSWKESSVRDLLNGTFLDCFFAEEEKKRICTTNLTNSNYYITHASSPDNRYANFKYHPHEDDSLDKVFILSLDDYIYYSFNLQRFVLDPEGKENGVLWTRCNISNGDDGVVLNPNSIWSKMEAETAASYDECYIFPAMWVEEYTDKVNEKPAICYMDSRPPLYETVEDIDICSLNKGDLLEFGNHRGTPLQWQIIDIDDDIAVMLCTESVNRLAYKSSNDDYVQWKDSDVYKWLNLEFFRYSFSMQEKKYIRAAEIENVSCDVFILSWGEMEHYFPFARTLTAKLRETTWLREGSSDEYNGTVLDADGGCLKKDYWMEFAVRPAIQLDLKRLKEKIDSKGEC